MSPEEQPSEPGATTDGDPDSRLSAQDRGVGTRVPIPGDGPGLSGLRTYEEEPVRTSHGQVDLAVHPSSLTHPLLLPRARSLFQNLARQSCVWVDVARGSNKGGGICLLRNVQTLPEHLDNVLIGAVKPAGNDLRQALQYQDTCLRPDFTQLSESSPLDAEEPGILRANGARGIFFAAEACRPAKHSPCFQHRDGEGLRVVRFEANLHLTGKKDVDLVGRISLYKDGSSCGVRLAPK